VGIWAGNGGQSIFKELQIEGAWGNTIIAGIDVQESVQDVYNYEFTNVKWEDVYNN